MSGGFFRGTSAEQDTRFSNKQAKLLKSQKFAPELEHLVDMTKVKMDVMRPWIAKRVTELIGFEDEVLINFIYSLLEHKVVNGKEVQISLTGFMERNTGKFMKELWALLLSAQNNASGVPQQFLEAKEEEMRKKKAEMDRIASEIQKKKEREYRELNQEKMKKMDDYDTNSTEKKAAREPTPRHQLQVHLIDDLDPVERNGSRLRNRRSRSISMSFSNSRSYSGERRRSQSTSGSPGERRGLALSSKKVYHYPPRCSISPRKKHSPSPPRHRRRSTSRVHRRSPSLTRFRRHSPFRRRSRSPLQWRLRSPLRCKLRSPTRRRSRSPVWCRSRSPSRHSAVRYISRSPIRCRSSLQCRAPSPTQRRSPSLVSRGYHRSPLSPWRSSPSLLQRKSSISGRKRSLTPVRSLSLQESLSPSPIHYSSPSPIRKRILKNEMSEVLSPRGRIRSCEKYSPFRHASPVKNEVHKLSRSLERRCPISFGSSQKNIYERKDSREKELPLPQLRGSPSVPESPSRSISDSESPPTKRGRSPRGLRSISNRRERKTIDTDSTSSKKLREHRISSDISVKIADEKEINHSREAFEHKFMSSRKILTTRDPHKDPAKGWDEREFSEIHSRSDRWELRKRSEVIQSEKLSGRMEHAKELDQQKSPSTHSHSHSPKRLKESYDGESFKADKENLSYTNVTKGKELHVESDAPLTSSRKVEENDLISSNEGSGFEESKKCRAKVEEKRKHKRPDRYESTSDDSFGSDVEDRKEAKRRRKEEKRLKKEEKRRRREERRRRKEDGRSQKLKSKSANVISSPSDTERNPDSRAFDDEHLRKENRHGHEIEESESLQKRLEIELRKKALEFLRAKKGISR